MRMDIQRLKLLPSEVLKHMELLTAEIFGNSDSIGQRAYQEMQAIKDEAKDKDKAIRKINSRFGESLDKLIAISELKEK